MVWSNQLLLALALQAAVGVDAACVRTSRRPTRTQGGGADNTAAPPSSTAVLLPTSAPIAPVTSGTRTRVRTSASAVRPSTSAFPNTGTSAAPPAATTSAAAAPANPVNGNEPAEFTAAPSVGPGGSQFVDSPHFRVYGATGDVAQGALDLLEGAYECFVGTLGWRSSGISFNDAAGTGGYFKTNIYNLPDLKDAAGVMQADMRAGAAYLEVGTPYMNAPGVIVHEYGHGLHYHQRTWVNQDNTGTWWETLANWVADTYQNSDLCADARAAHGFTGGQTEFTPTKVIGDSFQVLVDGTVDSGNYYQAWPFLTYLTNNPDNIAGLGTDCLHQMMVQYEENSNETPLHTLDRVATGATAGEIVGAYWARMAYVDIGHPKAQSVFEAQKSRINFANVDASGDSYKVKSARAPRYMGANIIPLKTTGGEVSVAVTSSGEFTATLAIRTTSSKAVRYVKLEGGSGSATIESGEEASLVVANTPATPITYNGFQLSGNKANEGMDYSFTLTGATA